MKEFYKSRRLALMEGLAAPAAVLIFSGKAPMRSADESYGFSVDRNFYYLTGIDRENMILMLKKMPGKEVTATLFIEPYSEELAKWVGGRMKRDEATAVSGIDDKIGRAHV